MRFSGKRGKAALSVLAATTFAFTLTACGGSSGGGSGSGGDTVTIWSSIDQPVQDGLKKDLVAKLKTSNPSIKIDWQKVENINQLIITKIQAGDTPDIALIPQPGVVADIVKRGVANPLDDVVDMNTLKSSMIPGTLDAGTVNGKLYGLLVSANVKGLVFYPKAAWDAAGYKAPQTIDELNALTTKIKASGTAPWCMGIESDTATGWPATDWFETLIAKYGGVSGYNDWVTHKTNFDSDLVKKAGAEFQNLIMTDGNTYGGIKSIASNNFGTAGNALFTSPPKCMMMNQGSFITGFFPKKITADLDKNVGVFGFPPATAGGDNPVEGGGDMAMLLNDSANAKAVIKAMSGKEIGDSAAPNSSFISPHKDFDTSLYPNQITKTIASVAYDSSAFLFDGSDQMPGEVGSGSFWKQMTAFVSGDQDLDTTLKNIDASWPTQ